MTGSVYASCKTIGECILWALFDCLCRIVRAVTWRFYFVPFSAICAFTLAPSNVLAVPGHNVDKGREYLELSDRWHWQHEPSLGVLSSDDLDLKIQCIHKLNIWDRWEDSSRYISPPYSHVIICLIYDVFAIEDHPFFIMVAKWRMLTIAGLIIGDWLLCFSGRILRLSLIQHSLYVGVVEKTPPPPLIGD